MSIFNHRNYRNYIRNYIEQLPKNGRGELLKIARSLNISSTLLSQIMGATRELSPEQTFLLSEYLGHTEIEKDYFSLLVQFERANNPDLKLYLNKKIDNLKSESMKLSKRMTFEKKLSEEQRSIFYSSWIYSAVHIFTSLNEKGFSLDEIAAKFDLGKVRTSEILHFLISSGIVTEDSGKFKLGVQSTFLEQGSPHLLKHHSSWRLRAIEKSERLSSSEMMVTGQYSISKKDFLVLREQLTVFMKSLQTTIVNTEPDQIVSLNIDWILID